jgi:hypothetical protein
MSFSHDQHNGAFEMHMHRDSPAIKYAADKMSGMLKSEFDEVKETCEYLQKKFLLCMKPMELKQNSLLQLWHKVGGAPSQALEYVNAIANDKVLTKTAFKGYQEVEPLLFFMVRMTLERIRKRLSVSSKKSSCSPAPNAVSAPPLLKPVPVVHGNFRATAPLWSGKHTTVKTREMSGVKKRQERSALLGEATQPLSRKRHKSFAPQLPPPSPPATSPKHPPQVGRLSLPVDFGVSLSAVVTEGTRLLPPSPPETPPKPPPQVVRQSLPADFGVSLSAVVTEEIVTVEGVSVNEDKGQGQISVKEKTKQKKKLKPADLEGMLSLLRGIYHEHETDFANLGFNCPIVYAANTSRLQMCCSMTASALHVGNSAVANRADRAKFVSQIPYTGTVNKKIIKADWFGTTFKDFNNQLYQIVRIDNVRIKHKIVAVILPEKLEVMCFTPKNIRQFISDGMGLV